MVGGKKNGEPLVQQLGHQLGQISILRQPEPDLLMHAGGTQLHAVADLVYSVNHQPDDLHPFVLTQSQHVWLQ